MSADSRGPRKSRGHRGRTKNEQRTAPEVPKERRLINVRLCELRRRIWSAGGIASCIEYASDSNLAPRQGKPDLAEAAAALYELLEDISGELEGIIKEVSEASDVEGAS